MKSIPVSFVEQMGGGWRGPRPKEAFPLPQVVSSRISSLALEKMDKAFNCSALMPAHVPPQVIAAVKEEESKREGSTVSYLRFLEKKTHSRKVFKERVPVGLKENHKCPWLNAWLQFIFNSSKISDLIALTFRTFEPLRFLMDCYLTEQLEGRSGSLRTEIVTDFVAPLMTALPFSFLDVSCLFFRSLQREIPLLDHGSFLGDSIAFHPEWMLSFDSDVVEKELSILMALQVPEWIIGGVCGKLAPSDLMKRQFFQKSHESFYDLDAFIESRLDAKGLFHFISYLKIGGGWYQCDDERIQSISSSAISVSLRRGILFHYKRLSII